MDLLNEIEVAIGERTYAARIHRNGVAVILLSEQGEPLLRYTTRWLAEQDAFASLPDWLPNDVHAELTLRVSRASRG